MSKQFLFLFAFTVFTMAVFADDAPVVPTQSGNVTPVFNKDIQMKSEIIKIVLHPEYYSVEVSYVFVNTSAKQDVTMGFPNHEGGIYSEPIKDFKAFESGKAFTIYTKMGEKQDTTIPLYIGRDYYECFDINFKAGETKLITNNYTQKYEYNYEDTRREAAYILKTGKYWKGKIESVKVFVDYSYMSKVDIEPRMAYSVWEYKDTVSYSGIQITPAPQKTTGGIAEMEFTNIEPDFDIHIVKSPPFLKYAFASSTLKSSNELYEAEHLIDNDPKTIWAEGAAGSGIGETIGIEFGSGRMGEEGTYINKIGITNGLVSDKTLFYKNNRVKKILLTVSEMTETDFNPVEMEFELKDDMKMQYITLPKSYLAKSIMIKIIEVYKGTTYDDTCISEVQVFPEVK